MASLRERSSLQFFSRDPAVGIAIAVTRRGHHRGRQGWRWGLAVPFALPLQIRQVVTQWLLVEARLAPARLVPVGRPEARRVRCQNLIDDDQGSFRRRAEFELRIGDDDAALRRVRSPGAIQIEAGLAQSLGGSTAQAARDVVEGDVLVVTLFGLGRGRKDRRIETRALDESLRPPQRLPRERTRLFVLGPRRSREIPTHHTFE